MSELSRMAKVNENGVLEVPKEVMDKLGLKAGDNVSVVERSGHIVIEKHIDHCVLCGSTENLVPPLYCVCDKCMAKIKDGRLMTTGMDF
ncbi:AbrB/MazE/SpoVT family DNA-binding domain-containing protein [Merdimmobilis hominis]|jgi:AbrB family looped-hinge helix DNA binding protein|uniref:AbrB/MazE/SpoVT family DNA-binding domain-containing protein n=1 Tax=Merdimmobilis hominis TaxID=2897707 RepID=UPI0006C80101|nr:AbrB/MazE/SpoVT family DNA-binding domain-containing protein [Merdimmobilis hominis]PWL64660.1 MAG: AbrB/MazE/SpoVT family DNA-binding domain-containing protein [Oscillospiraceae bacterium]